MAFKVVFTQDFTRADQLIEADYYTDENPGVFTTFKLSNGKTVRSLRTEMLEEVIRVDEEISETAREIAWHEDSKLKLYYLLHMANQRSPSVVDADAVAVVDLIEFHDDELNKLRSKNPAGQKDEVLSKLLKQHSAPEAVRVNKQPKGNRYIVVTQNKTISARDKVLLVDIAKLEVTASYDANHVHTAVDWAKSLNEQDRADVAA